MISEVVAYTKSLPEPPTFRELRQHFRRQGRDLLLARITEEETEICKQAGVAYFEQTPGVFYAVATVEELER